MRTHRLCMRCGTEVRKETVVKQYPFYCPKCDENLFRFETFNVKQMRGPIIPYRGERKEVVFPPSGTIFSCEYPIGKED